VLKNKLDLVDAGLQKQLADICVWSKPAGGLFMWVRLPEDVDMDKLMAVSRERKVFFAPGAAFHIDRKNDPYIRLAFGHVPDDLIVEGIPVLAQCVRESRTSNEAVKFTSLFG
jgi:DNA-binding transcriptional MocR family regulator